jgi:hypothetical protein
MKRIIDGKYMIQAFDLIFIGDSGLYTAPKTLWDELFTNDKLLDDISNNKNSYLELSTPEAINLYDISSVVLCADELDELSDEELEKLRTFFIKYKDRLKLLKNSSIPVDSIEFDEPIDDPFVNKIYDIIRSTSKTGNSIHQNIDIQSSVTNYMFDSFVEYLKERSNKNIFGPQKVNRI